MVEIMSYQDVLSWHMLLSLRSALSRGKLQCHSCTALYYYQLASEQVSAIERLLKGLKAGG